MDLVGYKDNLRVQQIWFELTPEILAEDQTVAIGSLFKFVEGHEAASSIQGGALLRID